MKRHSIIEPKEAGLVHFVGIGGIGMSGIAIVMHSLGYRVQGSDIAESATTRHLRGLGIPVFPGHAAGNVEGAGVLVVSAAIRDGNPEVLRAEEMRVPVIKRAEMLAEVMRLYFGIAVGGTHGKTTVTSLVAHLLSEGGLDPTYVIGGCVKISGLSARLGESDYLVVEADESDGSFEYLQPIIAVVTNMDNDHLDAYDGSVLRLEQAFARFIKRVPFYGRAVVCHDEPGLRRLSTSIPRHFLTYGLSEDSDIRALNVRHDDLTTSFDARVPWRSEPLSVCLNLPGNHNVLNALAALAVGHELDIEDAVMVDALRTFGGIARRFHVYPNLRLDGGSAYLVDDYGHHPTEIAATLDTTDKVWPDARKVMIFQPHRYTRTARLFESFVEILQRADRLILLSVYSAGESPIKGADSRSLSAAIGARGGTAPECVDTPDEVPAVLKSLLRTGDVVITMGAGSVGSLAGRLGEALDAA